MKQQFEHESLLPEEKKICFERSEFIQGQTVYVILLGGFPASSNRCRCVAAYSAISPTLASVKTNQEIMTFTDNINYQMYLSRSGEGKGGGGGEGDVRNFRIGPGRKPKKLINIRLFGSNKKLKA